MSADDKLKNVLSQKKYQVDIIINGKRKFAYLDDLKYIDLFAKTAKVKVLKVTELKVNKK